MNAVLCFVSDTLDLHFLDQHPFCPYLELGEIPHRGWDPPGVPVNTSLCLFLPQCKIMNSLKRVGDPLLYTFHLSLLCDRERQRGVERKGEVQTGSNIIETEIEALGLHCPVLVSIMDEQVAPSLGDEEGKCLSPGLPGPTLIH